MEPVAASHGAVLDSGSRPRAPHSRLPSPRTAFAATACCCSSRTRRQRRHHQEERGRQAARGWRPRRAHPERKCSAPTDFFSTGKSSLFLSMHLPSLTSLSHFSSLSIDQTGGKRRETSTTATAGEVRLLAWCSYRWMEGLPNVRWMENLTALAAPVQRPAPTRAPAHVLLLHSR